MRGNYHKLSILSRVTGGGDNGPPSSGLYERLENGGPDGNGSQRRGKFAWKKFAIGAAALIFIVWLVGPRKQAAKIFGSEDGERAADAVGAPEKVPANHVEAFEDDVDDELAHPPPRKTVSQATDPDPSKTIFCTTPHASAKRLVQWALMIDAGSTGSRIHAYKFNNCGPSPDYEYEVFKMTQPGLSSFGDDPEKAAQSLDALLDLAVQSVPESLHKCTPVAVKATAGLRLLGQAKSEAILKAVETRLHDKYPFPVLEKDGVVVMDGKDEGVYAWITVNYLLDAFQPSVHSHAVLDLGGGSTQIVFEPSILAQNPVVDGEHKYSLTFGKEHRELYQHSYLGYGLMSARKSVHRLVEFMHTLNFASGETEQNMNTVHSPCLAVGTRRDIELPVGPGGELRNVTLDGADIGSFEACRRVVELVMAKDAVCQVKPCSFHGVYQPSLLDSFPNGKVVLLSYFYDRINPLLPFDAASSASSQPQLTVGSVAMLAQRVCAGEESWQKYWGTNEDAMEELRGRPEYCLDLTFQHALLRLGYEFEDTREVSIQKKLRNTELGWCLGATMVMLHGDLQCRV
ncbi:hypothetical protein EXIGLDRAFT_602796 [Exidia glandulosa HHB12029]|uniref:guanosine-diphosphatase n=1 Tax=Exidia glandulosa HHB12029 TaxID=1314781 RepID=A0A165P3M0_EXIGL|nr:hypothetical protein EXIGLDRAFT_602796 [Exidia glandulosa HHB12029]